MKNRKEIRRYCQLIAEINSTHWSIDNSDPESDITNLEEKLTELENELVIILKTIVKD
jgi:hypothetical protein